jgi:hypothetical protein
MLFCSVGFLDMSPAMCAEETLPARVEPVCVDREATGYATFQSHNQKVVSNRHGIFMTHIRSRNADYTAQMWRLLRSTDGGKTFETLREETNATNPPAIETDADGVIYMVRPDFLDGNAYLYRFSPDSDFREPVVTAILGGSAGKYALLYDTQRRQLYYFPNNETLHVIAPDGAIRQSVRLTRAGPNAMLMYPLLSLSGDGQLHAAWTTQKHGIYLYWDIHHAVSPDAGASWKNLDGTALPLPITVDDTGPSLRITADDEFECHTWLSSFMVKEGKVHFLYEAQCKPPRQHYVRYDVATGRRDGDIQPAFGGKTISLMGLDGFFASRSDRPGSPLYCVGQDKGHVACLVSEDNGGTWRDYARSDEKFGAYSIGGCREVTDDGYVIGSFTDQVSSPASLTRDSKVYFFRIKAIPAAPGPAR